MFEHLSISRLPALKLLCGIAVGLTLQNLVQSRFDAISTIIATLFCAFAGIIVAVRSKHLSSIIHTGVYWGASICAGLVIGAEARESLLYTSTHNAEHQQSCAVQGEMRAVVIGDVLRIMRRDSTPTAHILKVVVSGIVDAEPLPRLAEQRILLTLIFPTSNAAFSNAASFSLLPTDIHAGSRIYACTQLRQPYRALLPTDIDEQQYAASLGVAWFATATANASDCALLGANSTLQTHLEYIQAWLEERVNTLFPPETAPFALALLTGNTQHLSADTKREYARAGTAHVLAVSGLHLTVIAGIVLVPLGFIRRRWLKFWAFVVVITCFVVVTGAAPSALRAGVMTALVFLVIPLERTAVLLNVLAFSIVSLLLVQPNIVFSVGFQMSVAAIIGIALVIPLCEQFVRTWTDGKPAMMRLRENTILRAVLQAITLTLAASCVVAPIVAWYFGTFSLISPLANLVVVPLSSIAMVYTIASVGVSFVWLGGAELFAQTAHQCLYWMNNINGAAAEFELSALEGRWAFAAACTAALFLVYVCSSASRRQSIFRLGVSICALFGGILLVQEFSMQPQTALHIMPRRQITAAHVQHGRVHTLLLQDRRLPSNNSNRRSDIPQPDVGFERFVGEYCLPLVDTLTLCVTGPASMLIASRIALQHIALQQNDLLPNNKVRILATTLTYKGQRWFQALDSVQARGVPLVNAQEYLRSDSSVVLLTQQDSVRLVWNIWQAKVDIERRLADGRLKKTEILLPQEQCERSIFFK